MRRKSKTLQGANLELQEIEPLTKNQLKAFESEKNMVLHGSQEPEKPSLRATSHSMI